MASPLTRPQRQLLKDTLDRGGRIALTGGERPSGYGSAHFTTATILADRGLGVIEKPQSAPGTYYFVINADGRTALQS